MDSSSSSPLHLALATLFGASVMAISAFYIHKRSVDQVLLKLSKLRRKSSRFENFTNNYNNNNLIVSDTDSYKFRDEIGERLELCRVSSSVPNVGLPNEWLNQDSVQTVSNSILNSMVMDNQLDLIASGLPPLRTDHTDGNEIIYIFCDLFFDI